MKIKCSLTVLLLLFITGVSYGQLVEYGISFKNSETSKKNTRLNNTPLTLPFWEDFYNTPYGVPSDSLWENSNNVLVNSHYAIHPPSMGTATLDGLKANGMPYNDDSQSSSFTDSLISKGIDLSSYSSADNIFLSFFYQMGGNGEAPNVQEGDRLVVEFKNSEGIWQQAELIEPDEVLETNEFYQILLPVTDPQFLHNDFQFMIRRYGNESGPFDIWNLDYFYMNSNRSQDDVYYPDRTVVRGLNNIFNTYYAIPRSHINFEEDFVYPDYLFQTLYNTFQIYAHQVKITLYTEDETLTTLYPTPLDNETVNENQIVTVPVDKELSDSGFPEEDSSVYKIEYEIGIQTFDNRPGASGDSSGNYMPHYHPIDFRTNDTIRKVYELGDYYAYDDGTAEAAAGLITSGNRIAYKFGLHNVDTAFLHAIDINTIHAGESAQGKSIDLHIWAHHNGLPGAELYRERITVNTTDSRTDFYRYMLRRPILVRDTFHIGFTMQSSGGLPIGLDKNTVNSDKITEYVNGAWQPIGDRIVGSLMMRPVVGPVPEGPITGIEDEIKSRIKVYPNPSYDGNFILKGEIGEVNIYALSGRTITFELSRNVDYSDLYISQKGIFIIKIITNKSIEYHKIIVR